MDLSILPSFATVQIVEKAQAFSHVLARLARCDSLRVQASLPTWRTSDRSIVLAWQTIDAHPLRPPPPIRKHCEVLAFLESWEFFSCITFSPPLHFFFFFFFFPWSSGQFTYCHTIQNYYYLLRLHSLEPASPCEVPLSPSCSVTEALISRCDPRDGQSG
jgi:hypothetical protein